MSSNREEGKSDSGKRFERNPDTTLFVGGIDEEMPEAEFLKAFEPFGRIVDHTILVGKKCGFIQYEKISEAELALNKMNGVTLGRFPIRVNFKNIKPLNHMGKQALMKRSQERYDGPGYSQRPYQVSRSPPRRNDYDSQYYQQPNKNFDQRNQSGYNSGSGNMMLKRNYDYESDGRFYENPEMKKPKFEDEYRYNKPLPPPLPHQQQPGMMEQPKVDESFNLRKKIIEEEKKLLDQYHYINSLRKMLSFQTIKDYDFQEIQDSKIRFVKLSELFLTSNSLIVFHLDNPNCSYCTTLIDTFQSNLPLLNKKANFVVVGKSSPQSLDALSNDRFWKNRVVSSELNSFNSDFAVEADGVQQPGISVFHLNQGFVTHTYSTGLTIITKDHHTLDLFGGVWSLLDLLPNGRQ